LPKESLPQSADNPVLFVIIDLPSNRHDFFFNEIVEVTGCLSTLASRSLKNSRDTFATAQRDTTGRADTHASRVFIFRQPVNTEVTLYGYFPVVFELHGIEGTGFDTLPAADAKLVVD